MKRKERYNWHGFKLPHKALTRLIIEHCYEIRKYGNVLLKSISVNQVAFCGFNWFTYCGIHNTSYTGNKSEFKKTELRHKTLLTD